MSDEEHKKKAKGPPPEEKGESAPLWIISFADMISLLMAFFVMLLTMAHEKSGKLCNIGEGVFERTIVGFKGSSSGLGFPGLFGRANEPATFTHGKSHYNMTGDNDNTDERTIDATQEKIRRLYNQVKEGMQTYSRQRKGDRINFAVTPIVFQRGQAEVEEEGRRFLKQFWLNLQESGSRQADIYIMGLAPEGLTEQQKWILSLRRAKVAGDYIKSVMPESQQREINIHCWGCGDSHQWLGMAATTEHQPQILIAVLNKTN